MSCWQARRYEEVRRQEKELLEAKSIPLRNFLMKHVMPTLTKGLIECCQVRPDDPVDFLVGPSVEFECGHREMTPSTLSNLYCIFSFKELTFPCSARFALSRSRCSSNHLTSYLHKIS